jgi:hypothetical protein
MKKIIPILILFFLLLSCTEGENKKKIGELKVKNDWIKLELKGEVKEISRSIYNVIFSGTLESVLSGKGEASKGEKTENSSTTTFNKMGFQITEKEFNKSDETLYNTYVYEYDDNGNLIESTKKSDDGSIISKFTYKYDDKGNQIEENRYNKDGESVRSKVCKYDDNGNLIEKNDRFGPRGHHQVEVYKYDTKGNIVETYETIIDDTIEHSVKKNTYTFLYDDKGNRIEINEYDREGKLTERITNKFDDKKNIIEEAYYIGGFPFPATRITHIFDDKGNEIESDHYEGGGKPEVSKYEYDKTQNWIKVTKFKNDKPFLIIERKIVYF